MIAKSNWFKLRKYGGWGLDPRTWQGWLYVLFFLVIELFVWFGLNTSFRNKLVIIGVIMLIGLIDLFDVFLNMKLDEREETHQAKAERNASFAMVIILTIGIIYYVFKSVFTNSFYIDPFIIVAIFVGSATKAITYYKLEK